MAAKDDEGPSLELPSLGFGRKRGKKARNTDDDTTVVPEQTPAEAPAPAPVAPELADEPAPAESPAEPVAHPEPVAAAEPVTAPEPVAAPEAVARPEAETATVPRHAEQPTTLLPPVPPPAPEAPPLFADEVRDSPTRVDTPAATAPRPLADEPPTESTHAKPKREFQLPALGGMAAALVTGAIVGVLMVGLTGAGFRLCEVIQGAPSCGDPGFLLLLAIVIVVIVVGKALLAAWAVPDPGSTSFLAVGLLCVVALLFLVDVLFNWWMIIVIPVVGMLCFALSHWVTTAFVEDE